MTKYTIRINCSCWEDIEVEAENDKEAIRLAKSQFTCDADSPELGEILEKT